MHHAFWCGNSPSSNLCTWKSCWKGQTQAGFDSLFHRLFHEHLGCCTMCKQRNGKTLEVSCYGCEVSVSSEKFSNSSASEPRIKRSWDFDVWQENQMQLVAKKNSWRNSRKVTVSVTLFQICFVCFLLKSCSHSEQTAINIFCRISKCSTARIL